MKVLLTIGAFGIVGGAAAAVASTWFPAQKAPLERWSSALFISGLALVGFGFPIL
ncbi:MAG TPA: hypothetical protein VMU87_09900 [Stellaceae bacterium]|nr:hypothetical protein [Stellaceae bacterium]